MTSLLIPIRRFAGRAAGICYCQKRPFILKLNHRSMATISATPPTTLVDEKVAIKLSGLDPGSKVTVRSYIPEQGLYFEAHGHFIVSKDGDVSLDQHPSVGGTYTDVEPMGLFWSMIQSPGQRRGLRFAKRDVTTPLQVTLSVHNGHLDLSTLQNNVPIVETRILRTYLGPNVDIVKVHSGSVRGLVFKPKGPGPFKGIMDMFGSGGGCIQFRAALLASHGFATYALPFFRYEDLPETMADLDLDYFEEATDWLQQQSYVQPGGIGLCAVSWGAEVAALMASTFPEKISACVSINGSVVRSWAPLTYKGRDLPFLGFDITRLRPVSDGDPPVMNTFDLVDPVETAPAEAIIQIEKAQHFLFIVGLDDKNWNAPLYIDGAERRLRALGRNNYEIVRYPKAGHLIEPPYAPITLESYHGILSSIIQWGGSPREHQRACEDHWPRLMQFLNKYVGVKHSQPISVVSGL